MKKVGIIGATGYVGAEILRLLLSFHKKVTVSSISSVSFEGEKYDSVYKSFINKTDLVLEDSSSVIESSDIIFVALPHGLSEEIASKCLFKNKICIDLGADFRLSKEEDYKAYYDKNFKIKELHKISVYGLPELNREKIKNSRLIACPGCYPTSIELGLMPALQNNIIETNNIIIDSKSGLSGSGRNLSKKSHFTFANENFCAYNLGTHRHIPEILENLKNISKRDVNITFTPHLLPINRGILSTIYCTLNKDITLKEIHKHYKDKFKNEPFINILPLNETADIKDVAFSNYCNISLHKNDSNNTLIILSAIDNMIKGSAGQAIQNMNIILGLPENTGLNFISPSF